MINIVHIWLSTQCKQLSGVVCGMVLSNVEGESEGQLLAVWPEEKKISKALFAVGEKSLTNKQCRLHTHSLADQDTGEPLDQVTCPLRLQGRIVGSVVLAFAKRPPKQQNDLLIQFQSGLAWFESLAALESSLQNDQLVTLVELVAAGLEHDRFEQSAVDIVTELARHFSCDRVSIGFVVGNTVKITALSSSASFDSKSDLLCAMNDAMLEAVEQGEPVVLPPVSENTFQLTISHKKLQRKYNSDALCTIPLFSHGAVIGVLLFERSQGESFGPQFISSCQQISALLGPLFEMRRREERTVWRRSVDGVKDFLQRVFGPGSLGVKAALVLSLSVVILLTMVSGEYQVNASAVLEAHSQRAVVALQKGYIAKADVRAGDIVQTGELLGALDNRDLKLEEQRALSEHEQLHKEYREALAQHDRTRINILKTKIVQVKAQIDLLRAQLMRTQFLAPIDGLVVSGDLSQVLGSPVEKGQVLFEIAPLGKYHVILEVEEDDIREIRVGQQGTLLLSSMVATPVIFTVSRITPVSSVGQGRNVFRVEADMAFTSDLLRPGMSGVAKISIDERKLIWIWSHKAFNWLRLKLWAWSL